MAAVIQLKRERFIMNDLFIRDHYFKETPA